MASGVAGREDPVPSTVLLDLVRDIGHLPRKLSGDSPYRKDCIDLVRRITLLAHLFEEIGGFNGDGSGMSAAAAASSSSGSPDASHLLLSDLVAALQAAKRVVLFAGNLRSRDCSNVEAAKKTVSLFQEVTEKLEKALGGILCEQFNISEEVQEQVELGRAQLRRAAEKYASMASTHQLLDEETNSQTVRKMNELRLENIGPVDEDGSARSDTPLTTNEPAGGIAGQITHISERQKNPCVPFKACLARKGQVDISTENSLAHIKKPDEVVVPDDFVCPISWELMRDPVILSTGQTYERSCIQRWIDCGNGTCPKTQQKLRNFTLTPNYVLRRLITQWCVEHNVMQPTGLTNGKIRKPDGSFQEVKGDVAVIEGLVHKLSSSSLEEQRSAVSNIRVLSKRSTDNRILIAEAGAIPALIDLLCSEDVLTQQNAVTSILNLSIYENNKGLIMLAGAVPQIVRVLSVGSMEARENAAATLFSLTVKDENKIIIGASGAIPALVELLQDGSTRGKKDALSALFNLCMYQGNKGRAVKAGIVPALLKLLTDASHGMVDEALTIMSLLASHHEAKEAIAKAGTIPVLIDLLRTALPRSKENTAAILLCLCKRNSESLAGISRLGAVIPLMELTKSGTDRAKRKATLLLELLQKSQVIV